MIESNSSTKVSQNLNMKINKKNREFSNACTHPHPQQKQNLIHQIPLVV